MHDAHIIATLAAMASRIAGLCRLAPPQAALSQLTGRLVRYQPKAACEFHEKLRCGLG